MAAREAPPAERRTRGAAPLRVFFALWPDPAARDAAAALAHDVVVRHAGRAPRRENVHLTLAFVGDVAREQVPALAAIGAMTAPAVAPFTLQLDLLGGFRDARIAWLGVEPVPAPLAVLAGRLREALAAERFRVDRRPFAAHVTLVRNCQSVPARESVVPIRWPVDQLALVASELAAGGSRYRAMAAWPLSGTA